MSGDLRVSMIFQANAAQAKAEVQALRAGFDGIAQDAKAAGAAANTSAAGVGAVGQAAQVAAGGMSDAAAAGAEWNVFVQGMRSQLQPMVGELAALEAATAQLSFYEEAGALTAQEAALAHDQLARATTDLLGRMEAAGVSIDGTTAAMGRQETAAQELINRTTGVSTATEESIADTLRHGAALDDLRARYNPLFAASRQYEIELRGIAEAERLGAISAAEATNARTRAAQALAPIPAQISRMGAESGRASAQVGQLGYQLNDIVMMMSMGQNPFMLMVQQGPQVTQVFDDIRRSGGSIGTILKSAFTGLLNPVNLATMAVIGFGTAAVQWMLSTEEEVKSVEDAFADLEAAVSRFQETTRKLATAPEEATKAFGRLADEVQRAFKAQVEQDERNAVKKLQGDAEAATGSLLRTASAREALLAGNRGGKFVLAEEFDISASAAQSLLLALEDLNSAEGPDQLAEAALRVMNAIDGARDSAGNLPEPLAAAHAEMARLVEKAGEIVGTSEAAKRATIDWKEVISEAASAMASVVASAPGGGWLNGAIGDAAALAGQLWDAAKAAAAARGGAVVSANPTKGPAFEGGGRSGSSLAPYIAPAPTLDDLIAGDAKRNFGSSGRTGSSGGAGSAAREETSALQKLIEKQEAQIEALRIVSPLQEEIAKHHKELAGATDAERAAVEDLVAERMRLEEVRDRLDDIERTGEDTFKGLVTGAMSFDDAVSNILGSLAEMAASDAWDLLWGGGSGGGGLGGLLGGFMGLGSSGGTGSLGLPMPFADGGRVVGPGGPRDDKVPAWLSNDEFVVNAAAAGPAMPFLEALNAGVPVHRLIAMAGGRVPMLADGGTLDGRGASPSSWGLGGGQRGAGGRGEPMSLAVKIWLDKDLNLKAEVKNIAGGVAAEVSEAMIGEFSRHSLPGRVIDISNNPDVRG